MAFDFAIFRGRLDWVNQPPSLDEKRAMENFIPRGTPYGGEKWQKRIAKKLGIESSHYDPEEGPGRQ